MNKFSKKVLFIVILSGLIIVSIYLASNGYFGGRTTYIQTFTGSLASSDTLESQVQMWILQNGNKIDLVSIKNNRDEIKNADDELIITVKYKKKD